MTGPDDYLSALMETQFTDSTGVVWVLSMARDYYEDRVAFRSRAFRWGQREDGTPVQRASRLDYPKHPKDQKTYYELRMALFSAWHRVVHKKETGDMWLHKTGGNR